jgi:hypothetical protein
MISAAGHGCVWRGACRAWEQARQAGAQVEADPVAHVAAVARPKAVRARPSPGES